MRSTLSILSFAAIFLITSSGALASVDPDCVEYVEDVFEVTDDSCEDSVCGFYFRVRALEGENPLVGITLLIGTEQDPFVAAPLKTTDTDDGYFATPFFVSESMLSELQVLGFYGVRNGCRLKAIYHVT